MYSTIHVTGPIVSKSMYIELFTIVNHVSHMVKAKKLNSVLDHKNIVQKCAITNPNRLKIYDSMES